MPGVRVQAHSFVEKKPATLQLQGRRFQLRKTQPDVKDRPSRPERRGSISEFSRKSRKRLFDLLNSFDKSVEKAIFITLTYGQAWPEGKTAKRHLDNFIKRMMRFAPGCSGVWRLEYQQRGAPHFHLLLFNMPFWKKEDVAKAWSEIIGDEYCDHSGPEIRAPFTRIEACMSYKHITRYLSKYVAKRDAGVGLTFSHNSLPGRFWGVINREALPLAPLQEIELFIEDTAGQVAYADFLRGVRRKVRGLRTNIRGGVVMYSENIELWHRYLDYLIAESRRNA